MRKQVYITADYSETDGDKDVVDEEKGSTGVRPHRIIGSDGID